MKLMMFEMAGRAVLGAVEGDQVIDLVAIDPALPPDLSGLIAAGPRALLAAKSAAATAPASARHALASVKPLMPISRSAKMI